MSTPESAIQDRSYRPDIDGLRAIAILSIVLNHAGVPLITACIASSISDVMTLVVAAMAKAVLTDAPPRAPSGVRPG